MAETIEVTVGVIGRAHGIKGDATIDVRTDEVSRRFQPGVALRTDSGKYLTVERVRWHQGRLLVAFNGHPDRTAVEELRGEVLNVEVQADEVPGSHEEFFDRHLTDLGGQGG